MGLLDKIEGGINNFFRNDISVDDFDKYLIKKKESEFCGKNIEDLELYIKENKKDIFTMYLGRVCGANFYYDYVAAKNVLERKIQEHSRVYANMVNLSR